ncbi:MAG: PAS domain-containing protein, partial [Gracilimonas sp.]
NYFVSNDETVIRVQFDNISLRNRIVEKLKKNKDKFENVVNRKDEFTLRFVIDESGDKICKFVSDTFSNITGLNPEIVLENGIGEVIHSDNLDDTEKALEKAFNGTPSSISCKYKTSKDKYISMVQSFKPIYGADKNHVESVKSVALIEVEIEN